jgi:hypothetical protein
MKDLFKIYEDLIVYKEDYISKTIERANYIEEFLEKEKVEYETFEHFTLVPKWERYFLEVDGKQVKVLPSGLKSGTIEEKNLKDSSDLENEYPHPNINFNSRLETSKDISTPVFYNTIALSVSKEDAKKVLEAKEVYGELKVKIKDVKNKNFVLGDLDKAKVGMVIHYDALWYGAIDNTSSFGLMLYMLKERKIDLNKVAVFLIGFTEVTYYWPEYWDYSFTRVKEKYEEYFEKFEKVLVVDCIGYKNTKVLNDEEYIEAYKTFGGRDKLIIVGTELEDLYAIYHATNDTIDKLSREQLEKDESLILEIIKKSVG